MMIELQKTQKSLREANDQLIKLKEKLRDEENQKIKAMNTTQHYISLFELYKAKTELLQETIIKALK